MSKSSTKRSTDRPEFEAILFLIRYLSDREREILRREWEEKDAAALARGHRGIPRDISDRMDAEHGDMRCTHEKIVTLPGGQWAKCEACGDDTFPVSEEAAEGRAPAPGMEQEDDAMRRARAVMLTVGMGAHSTADIEKVAAAIRGAVDVQKRNGCDYCAR